MARTIRFHLDESCDLVLAEGLQRHGIDVTASQDSDMLGASDEQQLAFAAAANGRILFCHDIDFLALHKTGIAHAGIIYCHQQRYPLGEIIRLLELVWEIYEPHELLCKFEWL